MKKSDIQIRDPFVLPLPGKGRYLLFGSTDPNIWSGQGLGFDCFESRDLEDWHGPIPSFRPPPDFWSNTQFWAPECHPWKGRYYLFASFARDGRRPRHPNPGCRLSRGSLPDPQRWAGHPARLGVPGWHPACRRARPALDGLLPRVGAGRGRRDVRRPAKRRFTPGCWRTTVALSCLCRLLGEAVRGQRPPEELRDRRPVPAPPAERQAAHALVDHRLRRVCHGLCGLGYRQHSWPLAAIRPAHLRHGWRAWDAIP